jgi:hypothetical protein
MLRLWPGSLVGQGCQPLGESAWACFHLIVSISAFFDTCCVHVVGSWMHVQQPTGVHLARVYGEVGEQPRHK